MHEYPVSAAMITSIVRAVLLAAQNQITDMTEKLSALRKQTADYYASLKKVVDAQTASMDQIKKLL